MSWVFFSDERDGHLYFRTPFMCLGRETFNPLPNKGRLCVWTYVIVICLASRGW